MQMHCLSNGSAGMIHRGADCATKGRAEGVEDKLRAGASKEIVRKESRGQGEVLKEPYNEESRTITVHPGQAFLGDNRSSSGLGLGDGLVSHTSKWLQVLHC